MEPLLTTEDVAEFFRVDVVTVRRMIGKGEITAYRVGGEYRFAQADIRSYLERQRVPARNDAQSVLGAIVRVPPKRGRGAAPPGGFGRLTERALHALSVAQEEAQRLNHPCIGTEHLLLAILRETDGAGMRLLEEAGCRVSAVLRVVQGQATASSGCEDSGEMRIAPVLKKVLQLAVDEAERLGRTSAGTEHLVLGILRAGQGAAARLLLDLGMSLEQTREHVRSIAEEDGTPS